VRAIESREQRDFCHTVKLAAKEQQSRLASDFEKAQDYHETARELASEASGHEPELPIARRLTWRFMPSAKERTIYVRHFCK